MFHKFTSLVASFCRCDVNYTHRWDADTREVTHTYNQTPVGDGLQARNRYFVMSNQSGAARIDCDVRTFILLSVVDAAGEFSGLKRLKVKTGSLRACQEFGLESWSVIPLRT